MQPADPRGMLELRLQGHHRMPKTTKAILTEIHFLISISREVVAGDSGLSL